MLGKDLFKVESNVDLSNERFKSLVLFYNPLITAEALVLYEFLVVKGDSNSFEELSKLLNSLNMSVEKFENLIAKLNQYYLVNTLKDDNLDKYIFVLNNPLTVEEFIKDDLLVRNFIHSTSGSYYQSLLMNVRVRSKHNNFNDQSIKLDPKVLDDWTEEDESFLKHKDKNSSFSFNTFFDVNKFLKDVSTNLLPLRYRTQENMKEMATLADLYNISSDKMRVYIARVVESDSNEFNVNLLRYLCENSQPEFKTIKQGEYDVPCELFLMNKQEGKEVTKYDKKIIYSLGHDYSLKPGVINVILEHGLNNCDNRLIEKYLYAIASDFHRSNIETSEEAIHRLSKYDARKTKDNTPTYDETNNPSIDRNKLNEILSRRGN